MKNQGLDHSLKQAQAGRSSATVPSSTLDKVIVVGEVIGVGADGELTIGYRAGIPPGFPVKSLVAVTNEDAGRRVALMFEGGDLRKPVILGFVEDDCDADSSGRDALVEGKKTVISASTDLVLQCGEASITLHNDGHVVIRGTDILTRSSGSNRIKGASVSIN